MRIPLWVSVDFACPSSCCDLSKISSTAAGSSSAAIRLMDGLPHPSHRWTSINSPCPALVYFLAVFFNVKATGRMFDLQADNLSPASNRSRCRDERQYGQWLRLWTPESAASAETKLWQAMQTKSPKVLREPCEPACRICCREKLVF